MRRVRDLVLIVCGLLVLQLFAAVAQRDTLPVEAAPSSSSDASFLNPQERGVFTGQWNMLAGTGAARFTLTMQQNGSHVTGTFSPQNGTVDGTVAGSRLTFQWTQDGGYKGSGYLDMNSDNISFSGVFTIVEGPTKGENSVTATRVRETPPSRTTAPSGVLSSTNEVLRARDTRSMVFTGREIEISISWYGIPLDWCRNWGVNCGKPAADAFCHFRGFAAANKFEMAPNIGRTVTFAEHRICNNPDCDGFKTIECIGTATVFETPWITAQMGYDARLDWCREWSANCGKPAADAYCNSKRFPKGALSFEIEKHVPVTVTFTERRQCKDCDGFKVIACAP